MAPWSVTVIAMAIAMAMAAVGLAAQDVSRDEALAGAYPGAQVRSEQVFLTQAQLAQVASRSGLDAPSALVARYIASRGGQVIGRAYVDTHTVRTKNESLLISLDASGLVMRIDVTAFLEPSEYRPSEPWLRQYRGRPLDADLGVNRAIRPLAGATLTSRAANAAVRRVLAIDQVLTSGAGR